MKAILEFDLPSELDAYLDAMNGARWREFVRHAQNYISMLRDTDENPKCREAFIALKTWLREEMGNAGLTHHTCKSLRDEYTRVEKFYSEQVEKHYSEQEAADFRAQKGPSPGTSETVAGSPKHKSGKRRTGGRTGAGHDNPPPA